MKNQFILFTISVMFLLLSACQNKEEVPGPQQQPASFVRELDADVKRMIEQSVASATTNSGAARLTAPPALDGPPSMLPLHPILREIEPMTEAQWVDEGYTQSFEETDLSAPLRTNIMQSFDADLTNWLTRAETQGGSDAQILADLKNTIRQSYNRSGTYTRELNPSPIRPRCICPPRQICNCPPGPETDLEVRHQFGLTDMEAQAAQETFYGVEQSMDQAYNEMLAFEQSQPGAANGRFLRKLWRAVKRVVVAAAVTALVVAVPVAAVAVGKVLFLGVAAKSIGVAVTTALVKGVTLSKGIMLTAALASGTAAGVKNAAKNWDKPWKGRQEFIYGIKIKTKR